MNRLDIWKQHEPMTLRPMLSMFMSRVPSWPWRQAAVFVSLAIPIADDMTESILQLSADLIAMTPSVSRSLDKFKLPHLKAVVFWGEEAREDDMTSWKSSMRVIHTYGPAECTPTSTINCDSESQYPSSIGRGTGIVTWVVDINTGLPLMPIGSLGELVLEGP